MKWKRRAKRFFILVIIVIMGGYFSMKALPQFGAAARGDRKERVKNAPNFKDGAFQNVEHTPVQSEDASMWKTMREFFKDDPSRVPGDTLEIVPFNKKKFTAGDSLNYVWFGHSSVMVRMSEKTILFDPVFSGHASPFAFMGPKQFEYSAEMAVEKLPEIDAVVISHDHYDHLDHETIKILKGKTAIFIVPLGVGAHLERWGIDKSKIVELNWWEEHTVDQLTFSCTPARHFSGRGLTDRNKTLWCSWLVKENDLSVFYSGDSGYGEHFAEIHKRYGDVSVAFIECGQYNENWPYIHMMPEQSVAVAKQLNAELAVPIHWGKFKLSLHSWTEPVERFSDQAEMLGVGYYVPRIGEIFNSAVEQREQWW